MNEQRRWLFVVSILVAMMGCDSAMTNGPAPVAPPSTQSAVPEAKVEPGPSSDAPMMTATAVEPASVLSPIVPAPDCKVVENPKADSANPPHGLGRVANAKCVVEAMRPWFRKCYQAGLLTNPNLQGTAEIHVRVDSKGKVGFVMIPTDSTLSPIASCLEATIRRGQFSPPSGKGGIVVIPLTLVPSK